jgi:hypothetical protein
VVVLGIAAAVVASLLYNTSIQAWIGGNYSGSGNKGCGFVT